METTPAPSTSAKKRTGLIAAILVAILLCLCLLAGLIAAVVVLLKSDAFALIKWQSYTNQEMGFNISYPAEWVYEESSDSVTFASSQAVLDEGPVQGGAGLIIFSFPAQQMTLSAAEFVDYFIQSGEWGDLQSAASVSESQISGYPAASTELSSFDATDNASYHLKLTVILTPEVYLVLVGASLEEVWPKYQATINHMVDSLEIHAP